MSETVTLALITFATVLVNLVFNAWKAGQDRRAQIEDREWKARQDARQITVEEKHEALMELNQAISADVQANTAVSQVAAQAATTGVAVGVKAAAAASGESEHQILAEVQTDLNRRLRGVFGMGEPDAEAEESRGNSARFPR